MANVIKYLLPVLLRVTGCADAKNIDGFVRENQRSVLTSFIVRLERSSMVNNRLYEKLRAGYSKEYCDIHSKEFYEFNWWMYNVHFSVKASKLRGVVKRRILRSRRLYNAMRRAYPGDGSLFREKDACFFQNEFISPLDEITDISEWEILQETHERIADRTAKILTEAYPRDLFSDGMFGWRREHRDIRKTIVRDATEIVESMADDDRLDGLLAGMIGLAVGYYKKMKNGGFFD